ncbi:unnamed protein product, partial [Owenia fusiformis]
GMGTSENLQLIRKPGIFERTTKRPDCALLRGYHHTQHASSFGLCSKVFSEVPNANVIYFEKNSECTIFHCYETKDGSDWDYKWGQENVVGEIYSLPHPSNYNCYGSYFIPRAWEKMNFKSDCTPISEKTVNNLAHCKQKACHDKANAFTIYQDTKSVMYCATKFCAGNKMDLTSTSGQIFYSLAHPDKPVNIQDLHPIKLPEHYTLNLHLPSRCKGFAYDKTKGKTEEHLKHFFDSGFNFVKYNKLIDETYTAYKCQTNSEETGYEHFKGCYPLKKTDTKSWYILPPPAIPRFNNGTFTLRSAGICQKANCDHQLIIYATKDLRQCMIYAFEKHYNVINYNSLTAVCDLRRCPVIHGDERDLNYTTQGVTPGFKVYAFQAYHHSNSTTITPNTTVATATTRAPRNPTSNNIKSNTTGLQVAAGIGWSAFIILVIGLVFLLCLSKNRFVRFIYHRFKI